MNELKKELYELCVKYVRERIDTVAQAISAAQQAANEETKSSAGDKYETGRAMMQQETGRNQAQLTEANRLMVALNHISTAAVSKKAEAGSVVITDNGNFYIAISAGALKVNCEIYFAISPASPIGIKLKGATAGSEVNVNGKRYCIKSIL